MIRMLAKSKTLTNYEPGPQFEPVIESTETSSEVIGTLAMAEQ